MVKLEFGWELGTKINTKKIDDANDNLDFFGAKISEHIKGKDNHDFSLQMHLVNMKKNCLEIYFQLYSTTADEFELSKFRDKLLKKFNLKKKKTVKWRKTTK